MSGVPPPELIERLNQGMMQMVPFNAALGLCVEEAVAGAVVVRLPYRAELVGNPDTGVLHGGAITSLLDASGGLAVFLKLERISRMATLDLRIDYYGPAVPPRDVRARAECLKLTRQIAFVRALAYHEDIADPIAAASGTFMVFDDPRSPFAKVTGG